MDSRHFGAVKLLYLSDEVWLMFDSGESVAAAVTLLESFCNCQTILNDNATRCTHLFKLQYDRYSMTLVGMTVEVMWLLCQLCD